MGRVLRVGLGPAGPDPAGRARPSGGGGLSVLCALCTCSVWRGLKELCGPGAGGERGCPAGTPREAGLGLGLVAGGGAESEARGDVGLSLPGLGALRGLVP